MPFQGLSKKDKQRVVDDRVNVSKEIFASCLAKANSILRNEFAQGNAAGVWAEQDRNRAVEVAKLLFCRVVSISDIREMAEEVHNPEIEDVKITHDAGDGSETYLIDGIGSF